MKIKFSKQVSSEEVNEIEEDQRISLTDEIYELDELKRSRTFANA